MVEYSGNQMEASKYFENSDECIDSYSQAVVNILSGDDTELWVGVGEVLETYEITSGKDRTYIIEAFGRVIENTGLPSTLRAQVVDLVSSLDLAQLEDIVKGTHQKVIHDIEQGEDLFPLFQATTNYLSMRKLRRREF